MADNLFEAKVDLELPVQVFADAYGNISRGLKRIYTKENGDVVFVLTDGTEHIVGNVVGQQGPTGPASTVPGPTGPTGATGKQGEPGKDGENGRDGNDGAPGIYYGSTQPSGPDFPVWIDPSGAAGIPLSITGPTGATGSPGATPNLSIGTVMTLEAGQNATASMGGTAESPVLNLGIPRGAKGEPGEGSGGGGTYYVELNGNYPNYTLSETTPLTDIAAAYNEGKALFCRCSMDVYTATLPLFVPMPAMNTWIFSGSGGSAKVNFPAQYFTIVVTAQGVSAEDKRLVRTDAIVASVSTDSTDSEVPSAKCLYDLVGNIADRINAL